MNRIIENRIGITTDKRELTEDKAAPATLTDFAKTKNPTTNINPSKEPKPNVSAEYSLTGKTIKNIIVIIDAIK